MPVVINGSTGISGTDGSAGTPAVQGTDTNTGLFFPAADTIAFAEGGTEVMRIDNAGNVGINYTNMSSLGTRLFVNGMSGFAATANGSPALGSRSNFTSTFENFSGGYGLGVQVSPATGAVTLQSQRLDGVATAYDVALNPLGGNVGIGTSAPTQRLSVDGNATFTGTAVMASSFLRNRIINGGMEIAQRATSATGTYNSTYTYTSVDRWAVFSVNSSTTQAQSTDAPAGFRNSVRLQRPAGNTGVGALLLGQAIESVNCYDLSGQSVTLSFWAKRGANYSGGNLTLLAVTGTTADQGLGLSGSWAGRQTPINTSFAITTTWTRYTATGTFGSGVLEAAVEFSWAGTGTAGADDSVYITGVQLEVGSAATPFERRQFGQELALCQRYFQKSYNLDIALGTASNFTGTVGRSPDATVFFLNFGPIRFPTTMRTSATVTAYNPSTGSTTNPVRAENSSTNHPLFIYNQGASGFLAFIDNNSIGTGNNCSFHYAATAEL